MTIDLGASAHVSRLVIRHAGAAGLDPRLNTRDFTVQTRQENEAWQTIAVVEGNTDSATDVELAPAQARYLRITIQAPGADEVVRLADVEVFGTR